MNLCILYICIIYRSDVLERLSQSFQLNITHTGDDKTYNLNFPGSKTIQEVWILDDHNNHLQTDELTVI